MRFFICLGLASLVGVAMLAAPAQAQVTTAITYQGRLQTGGAPANGNFDFQFVLFDSALGGAQVGGSQTFLGQIVNNGLFTLTPDFGATPFTNANRWMEIRVRPAGGGVYTTLLPRVRLTPTPFAISARRLQLPYTDTVTSASRAIDITNSGTGTAIYGEQANGNFGYLGGVAYGVYGDHTSGNYGYMGSSTYGVRGFGNGSNTSGVYGSSSAGVGVEALSSSNDAIYGRSSGADRSGVYGENSNAAGYGVFGRNTSGSATGNWGYLGGDNVGVYGQQRTGTSGTGVYGDGTVYGVRGITSYSDQNGGGAAVYGDNNAAGAGVGVRGDGNGVGVYGLSGSQNGFAVHGIANFGRAVYGLTSSGFGIYGRNDNAAGYAGWFQGRVNVTGTLSKGGGAFKIDHPLDPANKYLYHSFVESPDMMNIYNGNVTTDARGEAWVNLPEYFSALNKDFRYQLTVIGTFAQAIIGQEVEGNRFMIKTNQPNVKVSWQVTGIRQDRWANANRIPNEVEKSEKERGLFLHPELWGLGEEYSVTAIRDENMKVFERTNVAEDKR